MHMVTKYLGCSMRTTILYLFKKCQGFLFFKCRGGVVRNNLYSTIIPPPPRARSRYPFRRRTWFEGVVVVQGLLPPLRFLLQ